MLPDPMQAASPAAMAAALAKQNVTATISKPTITTSVKYEVATKSLRDVQNVNDALKDNVGMMSALASAGVGGNLTLSSSEAQTLVSEGFSCGPGNVKQGDGCARCAENTFSAVAGAAQCKPCGEGQEANERRTARQCPL